MFEAMGTRTEQLEHDAWRDAALAWFTRRIGTAGVRVVVAEVDGKVASGIVGEVTSLIPGPGTPNGSVGLISNVATLPRYRGHGLAGLVTDDLLRWFSSSTDVTRVDLFATPGGTRIYEPRGFVNRSFPGMCLAVAREPRDAQRTDLTTGSGPRKPSRGGVRRQVRAATDVSRSRPRA